MELKSADSLLEKLKNTEQRLAVERGALRQQESVVRELEQDYLLLKATIARWQAHAAD